MDDQLGIIGVWVTAAGVRRVDFRSAGDVEPTRPEEQLSTQAPPPHLATVLAALAEYLKGARRAFGLPLDLSAITPFQRRVYDRLLGIPYGHVVTYGDVARAVGGGDATARAVGQAVGANPAAILVPCHRVVAADLRLGGFGGGLARKAVLLRREGIDVEGTETTSRVRPDVLRLPF